MPFYLCVDLILVCLSVHLLKNEKHLTVRNPHCFLFQVKYVETSIDRDYNHNIERAFHDLVRLVRRKRHINGESWYEFEQEQLDCSARCSYFTGPFYSSAMCFCKSFHV